MDRALLKVVQGWASDHLVTSLMTFFTRMGKMPFFWLALLSWLFYQAVKEQRNTRRALHHWLSVVIGLALVLGASDGVSSRLIKPLVNRPRPYQQTPSETVSPSFPSSHAANSFGVAAFVSTLAPPRVLWWTLASLISFSRVALGVHYPTDVVGGALLGFVIGSIAAYLWAWRTRSFKKPHQTVPKEQAYSI